jgi:hypothetical protein
LDKLNVMANPRAFISFDFDNNSTERHLFIGMSKNSRTPFNIEDWSSKELLPQKQWEDLINTKVNCCNMLIVLVDEKTYTAKGVAKEITFATENNVPIFGVYVGKGNGSTVLPDGLKRSRICNWEWNAIADSVDQCMKEGKNK